jgi:hypothetical protein
VRRNEKLRKYAEQVEKVAFEPLTAQNTNLQLLIPSELKPAPILNE